MTECKTTVIIAQLFNKYIIPQTLVYFYIKCHCITSITDSSCPHCAFEEVIVSPINFL